MGEDNPNNLKEIPLEVKYTSRGEKDLADDFFIPCLSVSNRYDRISGYYNSNFLPHILRGLRPFIENNGKMRLIVGYIPSKELEIISKSEEELKQLIDDDFLKQFKTSDKLPGKDHLKFLAWLISNDILEIKLAVLLKDELSLAERDEILESGIFHEKVGIFYDSEGNSVSFSGSINETLAGWFKNEEEFKVFPNWKSDDYWRGDVRKFEEYWNDLALNLKIIDLSEETANYVKEITPKKFSDIDHKSIDGYYKKLREKYVKKLNIKEAFPLIPKEIELREYQKEAITNWFEKNGKGIFNMATGTGKTITALGLVGKLYEKIGNIAIIITCPYKHLVDQWDKEAKKFNLRPILGYESKKEWEDFLNSKIVDFNLGNTKCLCLITTNTTFQSEGMQDAISRIKGNSILIADEMHHLGAKKIRENLPQNIPFRLGLSATPKRRGDEEGNLTIDDYFENGEVYNFPLDRAINEDYLTKYYYHPILVKLTDGEMEDYLELSRKIAKLAPMIIQNEEFDNPLLFERARLLGKAENKILELSKIMKENKGSKYNLFYCGDGKTNGVRQVDIVVGILGSDLKMKVHPFTVEESLEERRKILENFSKGLLQGLVAIRCLDEGVDVPATQNAYILASTSNPRQFIQRRGRILRKFKGKDFANIYDFVVVPSSIDDLKRMKDSAFNAERSLLKKELKRVSEFASMAINGHQANEKLIELKKKYNLLDL